MFKVLEKYNALGCECPVCKKRKTLRSYYDGANLHQLTVKCGCGCLVVRCKTGAWTWVSSARYNADYARLRQLKRKNNASVEVRGGVKAEDSQADADAHTQAEQKEETGGKPKRRLPKKSKGKKAR